MRSAGAGLLLQGGACDQKLQDQESDCRGVEEIHSRKAALAAASRLSNGDSNYILKECSCGRKYRAEEWFRLPFTGYQKSKFMDGEMRQCKCQSTLLFITERKVGKHG